MKTHTDIKIWLCEDAEVEVATSGSCAWADVSGNVTIHAVSISGAMSDLDMLEKFFQDGLNAVQQARQGRLFADLAGRAAGRS